MQALLASIPMITEVSAVENLDAALKLIHSTSPALILLDAKIAGEAFAKICDQIRLMKSTGSLIVLAGEPKDAQIARRAGVRDIIRKGLAADQLRSLIMSISTRGG